MTAGRDASARVWDMRTKAQAMLLSGHTATVADVKCQDSDPQVITGSMDTTVRYALYFYLLCRVLTLGQIMGSGSRENNGSTHPS